MQSIQFLVRMHFLTLNGWNVNRNWSSDGVTTMLLSDLQVQCVSSHLSSFAVLVDHQGLIENDVRHTLSVYSGGVESI